jgi:hypothetical protein
MNDPSEANKAHLAVVAPDGDCGRSSDDGSGRVREQCREPEAHRSGLEPHRRLLGIYRSASQARRRVIEAIELGSVLLTVNFILHVTGVYW